MKKIVLLTIVTAMLVGCNTPERKAQRVLEQMTIRQKVAQLMMVSVDSYNPPAKRANRDSLVREEGIGGLIIMHDSIIRSAVRLNELQALSPIPLLVSVDGEWGPSMRYSAFPFFPRQMQLGALTDDSLVYEMGKAVAEECRVMNILINFAPVADININPNNPVINTRSFGEDRDKVTRMAIAYMRGMQDGGIYACAKHFPGHGDTDVDSHKALPVLPFTRERLDTLELYPFRELIRQGVAMVMIGHLNIPTLDDAVSTLSYPIVTDLLKKEMGFDGIVVTDALNMRGVSETLSPAEVTLAAYKAGVDLLLMPDDVKQSIDMIEAAVVKGECSEQDLNERVMKILVMKAKAGMLDEGYSAQIDTTGLNERACFAEHQQLIQQLSDRSITYLSGSQQNGECRMLNAERKTAYVAYNATYVPMKRQYGEQEGLSGFCPESGITENGTFLYRTLTDKMGSAIDYFTLSRDANQEQVEALNAALADYEHILFVCHDPAGRPKDDLIVPEHVSWLSPIMDERTTLIHFGTPYGMNHLPWIQQVGGILIGYADSQVNQIAVSKILLGEIEPQGKLPVSAGGFQAVGGKR